MKIWLLGSQGMLGKCILDLLKRKAVDVVGTARQEVDIADLASVEAFAKQVEPTHIINCAAYTNVDGAEKEKELAWAVNALGPKHLGLVANTYRIKIIHISTDYVFNGRSRVSYKEEDETDPINYYGMSKREGEENLLALSPDSCVIRTSWLFGRGGKNFISTLETLFQTKQELQVVDDQINRPTYCEDLADAILKLIDASGVFHFCNGGPASRYEIAKELLSVMKRQGMKVVCERVIPVKASLFPTPAKRPSYSVLDTAKVEGVLKEKPRHWKESLIDYYKARNS